MALGLRHGIDWDHIAAITDITSTTTANEPDDKWLVEEPGVLLTDESDHVAAELARQRPIAGAASVAVPAMDAGLGRVARFAVSPSHIPSPAPSTRAPRPASPGCSKTAGAF